MKHFLIMFDRPLGRLVSVREFPDAEYEIAAKLRLEEEIRHRENPEMEIVIISASSRHTVELTHGQYFRTPGQLARELAAKLGVR